MFSNKDLRKLIIPLVIEQLLAVTIGMADTVMVSSCGEAAVSGISLVDSINFLLITLFSSLATGGAVIASQYIGRGDHKSASLAAKQLFYASLALSAVLGVIAVFFRKPVLNMVFGSIEADVMAHAQIYFLLSAISYPFLAVYNAGAALFRSMGDSRTTMLISILMNTINCGQCDFNLRLPDGCSGRGDGFSCFPCSRRHHHYGAAFEPAPYYFL